MEMSVEMKRADPMESFNREFRCVRSHSLQLSTNRCISVSHQIYLLSSVATEEKNEIGLQESFYCFLSAEIRFISSC